MNAKQIDYLNIGLIVLSAILAYQFPMALFVLAFIILGPLHYFTEINWLDKKNYFIQGPKRLWLWIGLGASLLIMVPKFYYHFAGEEGALFPFMRDFNTWTNALIFLSLIAAVGFAFIRKPIYWVILGVPALIAAYFFNATTPYEQWIGLFLPTIIHVYFFTLLFMLYGAKKSGSRPGYLAVAVALFVPLFIASAQVNPTDYMFSKSMVDTYLQSGFESTPYRTADFLGILDPNVPFPRQSAGMKMMIFIAFIYLYHYLNWFSKTSLIQWHKTLTRKRSIIIGATWAILLILLYVDYSFGLLTAIFFSMLHVILEFPLNIVSLKGIFEKRAQ